MSKTNIGLVEYAKAQIGNPYIFGTFGQKITKKLLNEKSKQYPKQMSEARVQKAIDRGDIGKKAHDCYGLIKGFLMSDSPSAPAKYDPKYDISADECFKRATEKGTIDSLPEIAGIGLWKKGHFGIYIGNGKEIEARGFDYGVLEDDVSNTKFTHWCKIPDIEYISESQDASNSSENAPISSPSDSSVKTYIVKKGDTLSKIGAKFGISVSDLVRWNDIKNPDLIQIGQEIKLYEADADPVKDYFEGIVSTSKLPLNIRAGSSMSARVIGTLPKGAEVKIAYETGGWGKLYGQEGFVSMQFIRKI